MFPSFYPKPSADDHRVSAPLCEGIGAPIPPDHRPNRFYLDGRHWEPAQDAPPIVPEITGRLASIN